MTVVLGVDPGSVSGAWAVLVDGRFDSCDDLVTVADMVDPAVFAALVDRIKPGVAVVERVNAFPKQGVASSFRFGVAYGMIQGVLAGAYVPIRLVSPTLWKKHFRLGPDKEKSRALAIQCFPLAAKFLSRKRDVGRAEALLMALWQVEQERGL